MDYIVKRRKIAKNRIVSSCRPAQYAELPCSKFDSELIPHSAYVMFFVTFAYVTFCDKLRHILMQEIVREGGNEERMRKCRENEEMQKVNLSIPHYLSIHSSFPHSLPIFSSFPHSLSISSLQLLAAPLQGWSGLVVLGQYGVLLVGTWLYWVSIGQGCTNRCSLAAGLRGNGEKMRK